MGSEASNGLGGAGVSEANGVLRNHYYPSGVIKKRLYSSQKSLRIHLIFIVSLQLLFLNQHIRSIKTIYVYGIPDLE